MKQQVADALPLALTDEKYTTDLKEALPVITIVLPDKAKEADRNDEKCHIVSERLDEIKPGLPDVSVIAKAPTLLMEPTVAEFPPKQTKDPLCHQLASSDRTSGFDYSYNRN